MREVAFVAMATLALLITSSSIAQASVLKDGTLSCGAGKTAVAVTHGYGHVELKGPGDGAFTFYNIAGTTLVLKTNSGPGGYWAAGLWGTGAVDATSSGTYAYCSGA